MGCAFAKSTPDILNISGKDKGKPGRSSKKTCRIDCRKKSTQFVDAINQNITIDDRVLEESEKTLAEEVLKKHYLFSSLQSDEISAIIDEMLAGSISKGKYVFKQNDIGYCFFIIVKGEFEVEVDGKVQNRLKQKDSFGQLALLYSTSRTATIRSIGQQNRFLIVKSILLRKTLKEINTKNYQKIKNIINHVQCFGLLTNKQKSGLANIMFKVNFRKDEIIYSEKDAASSFYVIVEGSVVVKLPLQEQPLILGKYQSFGESSFWQDGKRLGTVVANEDTVCMMIGKNQIKTCFGESFSNVAYFNVQKWALRSCPIFKEINPLDIDKISAAFKIKYGKKDQVLVQKQTKPEFLIISLEGTINSKPTGSLFCSEFYKKDDMVISQSIIKDNQGVYSTLSFKELNEIINKIHLSKRRGSVNSYQSDRQNKMPIDMNQFELIKKLGEGQFGQVYLVRDPTRGGTYYALKCLDKLSIKKEGMETCVISEKKILQSISFPYIVGFFKAYSDKRYIYLLTEFINGMELFDVIREIGLISKPIAQYFFSCLMISTEYLHASNIIYRDIKPQNSVVDSNGKVFMIDLGTAKVLKADTLFRTFTIIGTPHYLAPEVMQGKGYTFDVDYWSLGVMLYEFVCGKLPFGESEEDPYAVYTQVMKQQLKFPSFFKDQQGIAVISKLISKVPSVRSSQGGFSAIKKLPYFSNFNWSELQKQKMIPPYVPKKFRGEQANIDQIQGTPFFNALYKSNQKKNKSNNNGFIVSEWNQKFDD